MISTIKKAEDDNNVVIRLYDATGKDSDVTITSFTDVKQALQTNMLEENGKTVKSEKNSITLHLGHHAIETFEFLY
ncbi:MAG: glycosyl hydrolase-related protein [Bacteroidetes bacterium]|nr:glycosyl hydrolase-related protein [Bacteroidota bacterium]